MAASAACSGLTRALSAGSRRRQQRCSNPSSNIRSSLEDEFKKQVLERMNSTSSSSQEQRLKDLSASHLSSDRAPASNYEEASPFAANLPLTEEPYHPLEFYPTSNVDVDWVSTSNPDQQWTAGYGSRCFVILFGVGRVETEGIYTLRALAKDDSLPMDTIVAFEDEDDAVRYSTLLEATLDYEPTVWPIDFGDLLDFCNSSGYRCRLELSGSWLIPPDSNIGTTDWEKSLRLDSGSLSELGGTQAVANEQRQAEGFFLDGPNWVFESAPIMQDEEEVHSEHVNAVIDSHLSSPAALAAVKASLERLLPQE